jgi:hypothetical protein
MLGLGETTHGSVMRRALSLVTIYSGMTGLRSRGFLVSRRSEAMPEHNNFQTLPEVPSLALETLDRLVGRWRMTGPEVEGGDFL